MGAANFPIPKASRYFVVLENWEETEYECPECGEINDEYGDAPGGKCDHCGVDNLTFKETQKTYYPEDFEYVEVQENVITILSDLGYDNALSKSGPELVKKNSLY